MNAPRLRRRAHSSVVEQWPFKPRVAGSSPAGPSNFILIKTIMETMLASATTILAAVAVFASYPTLKVLYNT